MPSTPELFDLVDKCEYIINASSTTNKNVHSLSYLIDLNLSHSDCIKMGHCIEKYLVEMVTRYTDLSNIKENTKKGSRECDHLFLDENNKRVIYAELKSNLNLDTEKSKSTINKCLYIANDLQTKYPEYSVQWCLLGCRYTSREDIPPFVINKYQPIVDNVFGINDYLRLVGINYKFTHRNYKILLNKIASVMLKHI